MRTSSNPNLYASDLTVLVSFGSSDFIFGVVDMVTYIFMAFVFFNYSFLFMNGGRLLHLFCLGS